MFLKINGGLKGNENAVLLTHLTEETYRLVRNLLYPRIIEDATFDELVSVLDAHFTPKRSSFADRAKFYEACKGEGESAEEWAARLRGLAAYCEFGVELDTLLRDRFVLGFPAGPERDRLCELELKSLTFAKALEVAQQTACARQARAIMVDAGMKQEPMFKVSDGVRRRGAGVVSSSRPPQDPSVCSVCGKTNHSSNRCRFRNYTCKNCGQRGHLAIMCGKKKSASKLYNLDEDSPSQAEVTECPDCDLFNLRYVTNDPLHLEVEINNYKMNMELDTGSGRNVMSDIMYNKLFSSVPLKKCELTMCLYNGHKISPIGCFVTKVSYANTTRDITFFVVKNGGPPLLGRDFMTKFNIFFSTHNNNITAINEGSGEVQRLLNEFPDLWKSGLGNFNKFEVNLTLNEDAKPKFFKSRVVPFALKNKVIDELNRLVKLGILVPVEFSEYATPIVPVLKGDGTVKIAGDYSCTLNKDLKIEKYPLPHIEEVFSKLSGGQHFSKIDLSNAYNQFRLSESSQRLTTINTPIGLFKYTRLVYGLSNGPAICQRAMETLLSGIEGVSIWLDDVCCTGPTKELHMSRLREVLKRLQDAGLKLNKEKCVFFRDDVTYLGYVIDKNGLRTCSKKVDAIIKAPVPKNVKEIKRFLGVVNYYRCFIPNASSLLHPLHKLLRNGAQWEWGAEQREAFDAVRRELSGERVLSHFLPDAPLVLSVDAGPAGLGAVLAHRDATGHERPIAFASRSLSASEKNYSQIQKEATAIIFGVKKFHQYLFGRQKPFILKTDHRPLLSIFGKKNGISVTAAMRLQRYAIILSAYNYTVQYVNSKNNAVADYFSRAPLPSVDSACEDDSSRFLLFLNANIEPVSFQDIRLATANDKVLQTVIKYMNNGWPRKMKCKQIQPYFNCKGDLEINGGCLFRGHRIVIPDVYKRRMLEELHCAHFGVIKTKSNARSRMWWAGIDADIERWVGACAACRETRAAPPRAPLAAWPRPPRPWHRLHLDYMTIKQATYLVVIDAFSKWLECIPMHRGTSTTALITKLKFIFSYFGIPKVIVSDNDPKISSNEFILFCKNNGIQYLTSPVYHPCSNGQAENSVKTCKKMIKSMLANEIIHTKEIEDKLLEFLFEYRNTVHCSTGKTPAQLMFGRKLTGRLDMMLQPEICNTKNSNIVNANLPPSRRFHVNEIVWAKWFTGRKYRWSMAKIIKTLGTRMFKIYFVKFNVTCNRHINQLIKCKKGNEVESSGSDKTLTSPTKPALEQLGQPAPEQVVPLELPSQTSPSPQSSHLEKGTELPEQSSDSEINLSEHGSEAEVLEGGEVTPGQSPERVAQSLPQPSVLTSPVCPGTSEQTDSSPKRNLRPRKIVDYKNFY